jgi:hypothetical protein
MFRHYNFLMENELKLDENIRADVAEHLRGLGTTFAEHFAATLNNNSCIRNPFSDTAVLRHIHWVLRR